MPEQTVKTSECENHRREIYSHIFPRWAAISLAAIIFGILTVAFTRQWMIADDAQHATTKAEYVDTKFTERFNAVQEDLKEIKGELKEQRAMLARIDRAVNRGE